MIGNMKPLWNHDTLGSKYKTVLAHSGLLATCYAEWLLSSPAPASVMGVVIVSSIQCRG